jgi:hypothetical protein
MWELTFCSLVENTCMTSSFTKKEFCTHKCYVYVFPVSVIILFDFGIVPMMWCVLLFISLYIHLYFGIYWFSLRLVDDDMFHLWLPVFLIQAFVLIFTFVCMLYLYYLLFSLWMLVLKFNLYSVLDCSIRDHGKCTLYRIAVYVNCTWTLFRIVVYVNGT